MFNKGTFTRKNIEEVKLEIIKEYYFKDAELDMYKLSRKLLVTYKYFKYKRQ